MLAEVLTPKTPRSTPVSLPVLVAVLPGDPPPVGELNLNVRGLRFGVTVGSANGGIKMIQPGQHLNAAITLSNPDGQPDLIGVDLAGLDLSGADLSHGSSTAAFQPANAGLFGGAVAVLLPNFASGSVFAGTGGGGLFRSDDSGAGTWTAANNGLDIPFVTAMARDGISGAIYAAGSRPDNTSSLFRSTDGGNSWTKLLDHVAQTILPTTDSLANPVILIGAPDGVLRSEDNGVSFTAINSGLTDLNVTSLIVDPDNKGTIEAASFDTKVFQSVDFGDHWNDISTGLPSIGENGARELRLDPHTRDLVLGTSSGLFERTLGSGSFTAVFAGAAEQVRVERDGVLQQLARPICTSPAATASSTSTAPRPRWTNVSSGLLDHELFAITVDLTSPSLVYTGGFSGVYVSSNGGASWSLSNQGLPNLAMFKLAIDPKTPTTLYAGSQRSGVWKTLDGGMTWAPINNGLSPTIGVIAAAVDPEKPSTLFIATQDNNTGARAWSCAPPTAAAPGTRWTARPRR